MLNNFCLRQSRFGKILERPLAITRIVLTLTMVTICLQPAWAGVQEGYDAF
jgi:hypothetical protein